MKAEYKISEGRGPGSDLIDDFLQDLELQGKSKGTVRDYSTYISRFAEFLENRESSVSFEEVGSQCLRDFIGNLREKGLSEKTIGNYFSGLSSFFEYLKFEELVEGNPVLPVRKRYVKNPNGNSGGSKRQLISVEEMSMLVNSILNARDRALIVLLAKTGIRRNELSAIDVSDIDWEDQSIRLKEKFREGKRTNLTVFFDDECARVLKRWLDEREEWLKEMQLFSIGENIENVVDNLDEENISERLKGRYRDEEYSLSDNGKYASISVEECGEVWKLNDYEEGYKHEIRVEDGKLNIYDEAPDALFLNEYGTRLKRHGIQYAVSKHAERVGLHDPDSDDLKDKFTAHCCRHWFTTHLRRNGMPREHIKELRGGSRSEAMDIYHHIDKEDLEESYLAHIPKLGL